MTHTLLKPIHPADAGALIESGAVLIDIRESDEHAIERIPGARHLPLSAVQKGARAPNGEGATIIYHCRSGFRTIANEQVLAAAADREAYVLEGGIEAWRDAGLPTEKTSSRVIEINRQVQIAAGFLILAGVALGALVNPWFYALSAFVGAGLTFAGVTGFCTMALLLLRMPWNKRFRRNAGGGAAAA